MHTIKVSFKIPNALPHDLITSWLEDLYSTWELQGQVLGRDYISSYCDNYYEIYVTVPEPDSLESKYASIYIEEILKKIKSSGIHVEYIYLGKDITTHTEVYAKNKIPPFYILFNMKGKNSPLVSGDTWEYIPLYRIPYTYMNCNYYNILDWQSNREACLNLSYEQSIYTSYQLSNIESELTKQGRAVCGLIEEKTGIPTYYVVSRPYDLANDAKYDCPGCGAIWKLKEIILDDVEYKCDTCRLLSTTSYRVSSKL